MSEIPLRSFTSTSVDNLTLDIRNPRFETGLQFSADSEELAIKYLCQISDVAELIISINENGFLPMEPLILHGTDADGRYKVIEGNRRLSAIRLLRDHELAARLEVRVPPVSAIALETTANVFVYRVGSPEEARAFIGFKHINGPQRWDSFAKARFATDWFKSATQEGGSVDSIARQLGDSHETIRSYVSSLLLLEQAEREGLFTVKDRERRGKFAFSHLYTALGRVEYRAFLGLESGWDKAASDSPVSQAKFSALKELLVFMYGSKTEAKPALIDSQNPDVAVLGQVLGNPDALMKLRNGSTLKEAKLDTIKLSDAFEHSLVSANLTLRKALDQLPKIESQDVTLSIIKILSELKAQVEILETFTKKKAGV